MHKPWRSVGLVALFLVTTHTGLAQADRAALPFAAGESLRYRAVSGRVGTFGTGVMRVEGPVTVRGEETLRLCFDFQGRVGPFKVRDGTRSWIVARKMLSLRYQKSERSPLGARDEAVEIFPTEQRWADASGVGGGHTPSLQPLDELSFLYFIRTLPLGEGSSHHLLRHFDQERNPVILRVLRRERVTVPAGEFATIVVEMRVRDRRVFAGNGALVLYLTDDARRIPVRIESSFPGVGATRLLLESAT